MRLGKKKIWEGNSVFLNAELFSGIKINDTQANSHGRKVITLTCG